ncbi:MAG: DHH family phosphoesterase [Clostridiales bacterium]|nr:DHH family phosphoesterase [Clostridiales bacterium]MDY4144324.1 DHH family phosphoesterase [Oscillospiraceae bacterium]
MNIRECAAWLDAHDNILLLTHVRPDGDTLGGAAALCSALSRMGKNAALYNNPDITPKYMKYVKDYIADGFEYDCTVAVDVAEAHMLPAGFTGEVDACIDHHPSNSHYAKELLLDGSKASCGEIVLEVIKELCGGLTAQEASLLYMAVSTDCGCFRYANVTSETFAAASELLSCGAEVQKLNFDLFRQVSRARMTLEGSILSGLKYFFDGKVVAATVTRKMMQDAGAIENDCDDIAGIPGKVEGCIVSLVIREMGDNKCKVSVRSHEVFDSSALCARFGGGGHKMASGCTITASPAETLDMLVSAIGEVL